MRRIAATDLEATQRPLFTELVAGTARHAATIDRVLQPFVSRPLDKLDRGIHLTLRLAAYQLLWLDRRSTATVVNDAVELGAHFVGHSTRAFVNGVLRAFLRGFRIEPSRGPPSRRRIEIAADRSALFLIDVLPDPLADRLGWLAAHYGVPRTFVASLMSRHGDAATTAVLTTANRRPETAVRIRGDRPAVLARLAAEGLELTPLIGAPEAYHWPSGHDVARHPAFLDGSITVQGPFATRVAPFLAPRAGETILDLCAAPGGKACHLADLAGAEARVVAVALDDDGLRRIRENVARLHATAVQPLLWDRRPETLHELDPDAILLDVPCSNSGVLSRRPEARSHLTDAAMASLTALQGDLLTSSLDLLLRRERSSRLVYANCSILDEEGSQIVERALEARPRLRLEAEIADLPTTAAQDGGYAALIRVAPA